MIYNSSELEITLMFNDWLNRIVAHSYGGNTPLKMTLQKSIWWHRKMFKIYSVEKKQIIEVIQSMNKFGGEKKAKLKQKK